MSIFKLIETADKGQSSESSAVGAGALAGLTAPLDFCIFGFFLPDRAPV